MTVLLVVVVLLAHKRRWAEAFSTLPSWPNPTHRVNLRCDFTLLSDVPNLIYSFMNQTLGNSKRSSWETLSIRLFMEFVKKKWCVGGREDVFREPWSPLQKKKIILICLFWFEKILDLNSDLTAGHHYPAQMFCFIEIWSEDRSQNAF